MKIATYNVNGVNGRLPVLLRWLKQSSPDVVCLQELKAPEEKFPVEAINKAGYNVIWHGQKSWNGVAILAKTGYELKEVGRGLPGDPEDLQSRYIEATVSGLLICNLISQTVILPRDPSLIINCRGLNGSQKKQRVYSNRKCLSFC